MVKIKITDASELDGLMDAAACSDTWISHAQSLDISSPGTCMGLFNYLPEPRASSTPRSLDGS